MAAFTPIEPPRIGNSRNDRLHALQYVRSWDDDMFRRQFRLCREDFGSVLRLISPLIQRNEKKAVASSGSRAAANDNLVDLSRRKVFGHDMV